MNEPKFEVYTSDNDAGDAINQFFDALHNLCTQYKVVGVLATIAVPFQEDGPTLRIASGFSLHPDLPMLTTAGAILSSGDSAVQQAFGAETQLRMALIAAASDTSPAN